MAENSKKRSSSFRRLFPSLFFSNKSKEKHSSKNSQTSIKVVSESTSKSNHYQNPRSVFIGSDKCYPESFTNNERIYENLTVTHRNNQIEILNNESLSTHSSSSTLVSESAKNNLSKPNLRTISNIDKEYDSYAARPQVPPKPHNEVVSSLQSNNFGHPQYPDVYYHSLEKLTDTISPLDEIEIFKASKAQANPASVGAEIKRVSTRFLISPKKEAEVRTLQPTRARSLSFDKENPGSKINQKENSKMNITTDRKPYNYSAPTSPIPLNHKIPNMPKTVSPYERVRKTMIEAEERRNSLGRSSSRLKSVPSPIASSNAQAHLDYHRSQTSTPQGDKKNEDLEKEKTRQKVEAFYWQKLKELKQKEDDYFLRQSLYSTVQKGLQKSSTSHSNSNCSTPNLYIQEPKSFSLPRGHNLNTTYERQPPASFAKQPFMRGAPERRTDSFIINRSSFEDPNIVYRHPEKMLSSTNAGQMYFIQQTPVSQHSSLTGDCRNVQQQKRVSFEEQLYAPKDRIQEIGTRGSDRILNSNTERYDPIISHSDNSANRAQRFTSGPKAMSKAPPLPPVRTTSVANAASKFMNDKNNIHLLRGSNSIYSESESGSEAGEIQRILQNNARKGKNSLITFHCYSIFYHFECCEVLSRVLLRHKTKD